MAKFWFVETLFDKSKMRVRVLPGQTYPGPDGSDILVDDSLNVSCDKRIRSTYPARTRYATESLTLSSDKSNYVAGKIHPLTNLLGGETTTPEMKKAYEEYLISDLAKTGGAGAAPAAPTPAAAAEPKTRHTYLQKLKLRTDLRPPQPEDGFYVPEDIWYVLIRNIENNVPTMLIGPTGSGKTEVINFIRERLGIAMAMHDMGSMVDAIANLIGVHRLKGGASVFDYAKFTEDIQQPGILVLDELSRAPGGTNNVLFPLLDFRKELPAALAGHDDERAFKLHEDCVIFATANVGAEYTGTSTMDRALIDRFFPLELDYMPADIEARLLKTRCAIGNTEATVIAKVAESIRGKAKSRDLSSAISTRHTLQAGDLVKDGFQVQVAMALAFLPIFEGTKTEGERSIVANAIAAR